MFPNIPYLFIRRMSRREGQDEGSLVGEGDFAQVSYDDRTVNTGSLLTLCCRHGKKWRGARTRHLLWRNSWLPWRQRLTHYLRQRRRTKGDFEDTMERKSLSLVPTRMQLSLGSGPLQVQWRATGKIMRYSQMAKQDSF